jgi:hypothetical protein
MPRDLDPWRNASLGLSALLALRTSGAVIHIELDNLWAIIRSASAEELAWLDTYLSVIESEYVEEWVTDDDGKRHRKPGSVDHERKLLLPRLETNLRQSFPGGLVRVVQRAMRQNGFPVHIADGRVLPCVPDPAQMPGWLRDYQVDCVKAICKHHQGIIQAGTGAGKSREAMEESIKEKLLPLIEPKPGVKIVLESQQIEELRHIVDEICCGHYYTSFQVPLVMWPMVFLPLGMKVELPEDTGMVYGSAADALPERILSFPILPKIKFLNKTDALRVHRAVKQELERRKTIQV